MLITNYIINMVFVDFTKIKQKTIDFTEKKYL